MPRYDDYDDADDYDDIRIDRRRGLDHGSKPQSGPGLGLGSIGIAAVMLVAFPLLIVAIAIMDNGNNGPPDKDPVMLTLSLGFLLLVGITLIGLVLGIISCCQPNRSMVLGLIGSTLNGLILFGVVALACVGLAMGG